jgi:hypothetical protein
MSGLQVGYFNGPFGKARAPVRLDGKVVGEIRVVSNGYQYFPTGEKTGGEVFQNIEACKRSLGDWQ